MLSDHTSYWDNRDEFVLSLMREIDLAAGTNLVRAADVDQVSVREFRSRRVAALSMARLAALAGIPLLGYGLRDFLSGFGASLLAAMAANPLTETIATAIAGAGALLVAPLVTVGKLDPSTMTAIGQGFLSTAILVLIVWLWYAFCPAIAWAAWDRQQFEILCQSRRNEALLERYGAVLAVIFLALAPPLAGLAAILFPQTATDLLRNGLDLIVLAYPMAFVCLMLALLVGLLWSIVQPLFAAVRWLLSPSRRRSHLDEHADERKRQG
jgi:hypothetical protein